MPIVNFAAIPQKPGVYFFLAPSSSRGRNGSGRILYIGKAANLRARIRSYFVQSADPSTSLRASLSPAKRALLNETKQITWEETPNDTAALVREAELIKERRPKYNILLRDDKNYFFVGFTKEAFPRIFLTHQPRKTYNQKHITNNKRHRSNRKVIGYRLSVISSYIGPFTDGGSLKRTLRLLRRIFPYATHKGFPKRCLEYDIGVCPIPPQAKTDSTWQIANSRKYRRNIQAIRDILAGKRMFLLKRLGKEMREAAKRNDFTAAAKLRDEMRGLERIFAHRSVLGKASEHAVPQREIPETIRKRFPKLSLERIEGYDIANLAEGKHATGAMAVFTNGRPDPQAYRQFRIRTVRRANDVAMLHEVLARRLKHTEWPLPTMMLIDGGKPQLNAALTAYSEWHTANSKTKLQTPYAIRHMPFAIVGLAKQNEELYLPGQARSLRLPKNDLFLHLLMHVRDEAHRFARRYHHRLRKLDKNI